LLTLLDLAHIQAAVGTKPRKFIVNRIDDRRIGDSMRTHTRVTGLGLGLLATLGLMSTTQAHANPGEPRIPVPAPGGTVYVEWVEPGLDTEAQIVVSPDRGPRKATPRSTCGPFAGWGPIGGSWSGEYSWINCTYVGASSTSTKYYSWATIPGSISTACTQGKGYLGGSTPYWASAGCGSSNGASIQWGNVWGTPKFKVKSMAVAFGVSVNWK